MCEYFRRVKENDMKKKDAQANGIKVNLKRQVLYAISVVIFNILPDFHV